MADHHIPHFQNDGGYKMIEIGAKEFMCIGANPPYDHPHIFLDMGGDVEKICPYCSTLYRYNPALGPTQSKPENCFYQPLATAV
ncbi:MULTISPECIES: zinc-finger domain-containing protein [unclassified Bartonella]|uniref:zinc-finger domain-containing protein n=1 Tax=unclassified Bartonella TaxID=2645622 RepID=UPI0015FCC7F3|nr:MULTISPECIES: zinc-finger domain-containing protein [unclassified Bartonella]UXM96168.1 zinc-finger domain-containing protein [Bartonella sp. HY329]UXN04270.1 zinc-finger domain-containing protein [Bartonella sp. HY406]UXN07262.1 zinc-finger domain-containing protein [Bartonella sp. HY761]UXN10492.1 zinc-finger domain-containing protein [Bartonella sp. HY328]